MFNPLTLISGIGLQRGVSRDLVHFHPVPSAQYLVNDEKMYAHK